MATDDFGRGTGPLPRPATQREYLMGGRAAKRAGAASFPDNGNKTKLRFLQVPLFLLRVRKLLT